MGRFAYKVRDAQGEMAQGVVQAITLEEAGRMLRGQGKFVVDLVASRDEAPARSAVALGGPSAAAGTNHDQPVGRIKRGEVISFAHQLAVMVDTGVALSEALHCIAEQTSNDAFRWVLADVKAHVESGGEFSAALAKHPKVFPTVLIALVKASEASGTLGPMLDRVSGYMQKEYATAKKIKGALMYPSFMLLMVACVTVFLLIFVLPQFAGIYAGRGATLPAPTRLLMAMSGAVTGHPYLWAGGLVTALMGLVFGIRTQNGKHAIDWLKLNVPVIGPLYTKLYVTRGCRTMGTMLAAGVPILEMVGIVRHVTPNAYYAALWDTVDEKLRRGSQLSDALFTAPKLIPRGVAQMVLSGEKSGRLSQTMDRIAEFTEQEFDDQVKTSTQFIEPMLIGVMGGVIGFVAIALLLPIFSVGKVISGG